MSDEKNVSNDEKIDRMDEVEPIDFPTSEIKPIALERKESYTSISELDFGTLSALTPGTHNEEINEIPETLQSCLRKAHHIPNSGDSLYEAVSHELPYDIDPTHFRGLVWDKIMEINKNGTKEQKKLIRSQVKHNGGLKEFEKLIKNPGEWEANLGEFLPHIISMILEIDVHVYDSNLQLLPKKCVVNGNSMKINLISHGGSHFDGTQSSFASNSGSPFVNMGDTFGSGRSSERSDLAQALQGLIMNRERSSRRSGLDGLSDLMGFPSGYGQNNKRFKVNDRVACKMGLYRWEKATILKVGSFSSPYAYIAKLDGSTSLSGTVVPQDDNNICKRLHVDDDHPILHQIPDTPTYKGKTLEGVWTFQYGRFEFRGHRLVFSPGAEAALNRINMKTSHVFELLSMSGAMENSQNMESNYIISEEEGEGPMLMMKYKGDRLLFSIQDEGRTLIPEMSRRNRKGLQFFGKVACFLLEPEGKIPIYNGISLEGNWHLSGLRVDCNFDVRGHKVFWGKEQVKQQRKQCEHAEATHGMKGHSEYSDFVIRGDELIFIDTSIVCRGYILAGGNTIIFPEESAWNKWEKITVSNIAEDFDVGLYKCVGIVDGLKHGEEIKITQIRRDNRKLYGTDDGKRWLKLVDGNRIFMEPQIQVVEVPECPTWYEMLPPNCTEAITAIIGNRTESCVELQETLIDEFGLIKEDIKSLLDWWFANQRAREMEIKFQIDEPLKLFMVNAEIRQVKLLRRVLDGCLKKNRPASVGVLSKQKHLGDQMPKALEVMIVAGFNRKAGVDEKIHCTPNISEIQHAIEFLLQKENEMKTQMKENNI